MVDIQLQLQNIIKLAEEANTQIAEIETMILQASYNFRIFLAYLKTYEISFKEKEMNMLKYKKIQDTYKQDDFEFKKLVTKDK